MMKTRKNDFNFDYDELGEPFAFAPLVNASSYEVQGDQIWQSIAHKLCI